MKLFLTAFLQAVATTIVVVILLLLSAATILALWHLLLWLLPS